MLNNVKVKYPDLGDMIFVRSQRAKYLRISIKNDCSITVTRPYAVSLIQAKKFLSSKQNWLLQQLRKIKNHPQITLPTPDRSKAKLILTARIQRLAQIHNFKYNRLYFRNQKTKWASCSGINNISLNINLVNLPQQLQDYVIIHELLHTKIKNHSREFWLTLEKYCPKARELNHQLKIYRFN